MRARRRAVVVIHHLLELLKGVLCFSGGFFAKALWDNEVAKAQRRRG